MFKNLKTTGISCFATLAMLLVGSGEAKAATITFDAEIYTSDVNTCSSPLTKAECFMEKGFNVAAFSAQKIGTDEAFFSESGHFHASNSYEAQHFSFNSRDAKESRLLGVFITAKDGGEFNLESLDYQLRTNDRTIDGYTTDDTNILISTTFDPTMPVLGQFTEYSIGKDTLPFQTLSVEGFENITQVFISSSGDVNFDNINLTPVPEPTSILGLLALGTFGGVSILKRKQK